MTHVFAYGSLARVLAGTPARLHGARRRWAVAMDNRHVVPGYKVWLDAGDGTRPRVHVAFLDLAPGTAHDAVAGVCVPVTRGVLRALDRRERNYTRVEVTGRVAGPSGGPVFAYVGSSGGRERFRAGVDEGTAVVARPYLDAVTAAFGDAIPAPPVPVRDLVRLDVPPPPRPAT